MMGVRLLRADDHEIVREGLRALLETRPIIVSRNHRRSSSLGRQSLQVPCLTYLTPSLRHKDYIVLPQEVTACSRWTILVPAI
jgi:hypothetical protein